MEAHNCEGPAEYHVLNGVDAALLDPHRAVLLLEECPDFYLQRFTIRIELDCKARRLGAFDVKLENDNTVDASCYEFVFFLKQTKMVNESRL